MSTYQANAKKRGTVRCHGLLAMTAVAGLGLAMCASSAKACWAVNTDQEIKDANCVVDCVTVAVGVKLKIKSGGTLILTGGNNDNVSTINGDLKLEANDSILRITANDHTLAGTGSVIGEDDDAVIQIGAASEANSLTLTSTTNITGGLEIAPNGMATGTMTFVNNGVVDANKSDNPLAICTDVVAGNGDWKVTSADAELRFWSGSTSLTGDFTVSSGTLKIYDTAETTGQLYFTHGTIEVGEGVHLTVNKED
jgi:hypothetical protein